MDGRVVAKIWDDLSARVGDDLRVVTRYEGREFEMRMREDVRAQYTADDDRLVVDHTIVTQLGLRDDEGSFKTGELDAFVRVFAEAWVLTWPNDLPAKTGVIVSIQRNGETASMDDVEWCLGYLDDEVAPLLD